MSIETATEEFETWAAAQPTGLTFDERLDALKGWMDEHPEYTVTRPTKH